MKFKKSLIYYVLSAILIALTGHFALSEIQNDLFQAGVTPQADFSGYYLLGSDHLGRSMFFQALYVLHRSIAVGFYTCIITMLIVMILAAVSLKNEKLSQFIVRFTDVYTLFPKIIVLVIVFGLLQNGITSIVTTLALILWPYSFRMIQAKFKQIEHSPIPESSKALGLTELRIFWNDYIRASASTIFIVMMKVYTESALLEASIQFLGFGNGAEHINLGVLLHQAVHHPGQIWQLITVTGCIVFLSIPLMWRRIEKFEEN